MKTKLLFRLNSVQERFKKLVSLRWSYIILTRRFSRSEHHSSLAIFGATALIKTLDVANQAKEAILRAGDNYYEPFDGPELIRKSIDFALSQPGVTGLFTTVDSTILSLFLEACRKSKAMTLARQEDLIVYAG
jgi:hypothetical protein